MRLIPDLRRQRLTELCEFKTSMVYVAFRPVRAI